MRGRGGRSMRHRGPLAGFAVLMVSLSLTATPARAAGHHVRVVLDVSQSMRTKDTSRLAILSTLLLHDLADLDRDLDDSFEVLPFHLTQHWRSPGDPPPTGIGTRIQARYGERERFVREIKALRYDGQMTYFYPGLLAAAGDLEGTPGGHRDVRVIVLLTDGLPETLTREEEARRIREEILPRLEAAGIRLYVLAFGPEAFTRQDFFEAMVEGSGKARLGQVFADPDGSRLLVHMSEIFGRSFGYTRTGAQDLAAASRLDLEGGETPHRVAVTVFSPRPDRPPSLELTPPPGGAVIAPGGRRTATEAGASYALTWVLSPDRGGYGFRSDASTGTVALLRPSRLGLEVEPAPPHTQAGRTMARTPFALQVLVRPPGGAAGDPGAVELTFQPRGPHTGTNRRGEYEYEWTGEPGAPPAGSEQVVPEGRRYPIEVVFPRDPAPGEESYRGFLEVEARRGEAVVGALRDAHAHPVVVYPLVRILPDPQVGDAVLSAGAAPRALGRGERACARFVLSLLDGRLPHPERPEWAVRAALDPVATSFAAELHEAAFTLDGLPLGVEGSPSPGGDEWSRGRTLGEEDLLGEHTLCVQLGRPRAGDPSHPLELPLTLTLLDSPYDEFQVIHPFTFKVLVSSQKDETWATLAILLALLLAALLALARLRYRPFLPEGLGFAVGREGAGGGLRTGTLGPPSWVSDLLGLVAERPVVVPGEGKTLAWVRPDFKDLYLLRPRQGGQVEALPGPDGGGKPLTASRGYYRLSVHRPYRLKVGGESFLFRLELP